MDATYKQALQLTLAHEGGYVNHPKDPGGATNFGVTQAVYNAYRKSINQPTRSVRFIDESEYSEIYAKNYWKKASCDRLPAGLDYAVFDYAVNSGVGRSVKDLQRTLNDFFDAGLAVDGIAGASTVQAACDAANAGEVALIEAYCNRRMKFLRSLHTFGTFGKGWTRRVLGNKANATGDSNDHGVIDYAVKIARDDLAYPVPPRQLPTAIGDKTGEFAGRGREEDKSLIKSKEGVGATLATIGVSGNTIFAAAQQVQPHIEDSFFGRMALIGFVLLVLIGVALLVLNFLDKRKELAGK